MNSSVIYQGKNNEFLSLKSVQEGESITFDQHLDAPLTIVWTKAKSVIEFEGQQYALPKNTIICLTKFHQLRFDALSEASMIKFNREFYCVLDHDKEVSCKGVLFYGANQLPYFEIPEYELETFKTVWKMFELEMRTYDEMQLDMLQTMLKRFLILCTRVYKAEHQLSPLPLEESDLLREYHYLVEQHFREKHSVQEYADLLNKSPKTLSNLFSKISEKSPLQIIHERIAMESKRLLRFSNKSIKEIAFELNFDDLQAFSRFFKKMENMSPSDFKKSAKGTIA